MDKTPEFPDLLRLIDDRSAAFRAAVAAAPDLEAMVPTCPEWTLRDLARHVGEGRRVWAATVAAGPDATAKVAPAGEPDAPREREALLEWLSASTRQLLDALREAGPDRACWAWWGRSQSPLTGTGIARRQLHEIAVHAYDAQLTAGVPEPLPAEVAVDGAEEFLSTFCTTTVAWPHEPAVVDYHATEGRSWRNSVSAAGAGFTRIPTPAEQPAPVAGAPDGPPAEQAAPVAGAPDGPPAGQAGADGRPAGQADGQPAGQAGAGGRAGSGPADASASGSAHDLVLAFYGRLPLDSLKLDGDRGLFDRLVEWDPER